MLSRLPYFDGDFWCGSAMEKARIIEKESGGDYEKMLKKQVSTRALKTLGHVNPSKDDAKDILVMQKAVVDDIPSNTTHNDHILENGLFEDRNNFLSFCQKYKFQFDTLRHAKYSLMMILYHLSNPRGSRNSRVALMPWHVVFGTYIYDLAIVTTTTGLLEKATFLQTNNVISRYSNEAILVNVLGILIVALGGFVILGLVKPTFNKADVLRGNE
ncbi:hypothetical protein KIW84_011587 [Lathyrus oleraceus]|uniref:histone acetyltransferase n=1 Tax=Pisum sativum TaxID=3888 RepID=A0A9D5BFF2_PEA|nr:hypothetical protein KIW84_011587 [Pisum sativum]